jgi:tRNA A37 threonylcarbamoyladenosine dehydratase
MRVLDAHCHLQDDALAADLTRVLVDAIDSVGPKVALLAAAARRGLRTISSMGAALRTDPLAVRVEDLSQTRGCPLARLVRKRLGAQDIRSGIRCVYSIEPTTRGPADVPPPAAEQETLSRGRTRRVLGSFSCLTGIFGLVAAREAIMMIVRPEVMRQ